MPDKFLLGFIEDKFLLELGKINLLQSVFVLLIHPRQDSFQDERGGGGHTHSAEPKFYGRWGKIKIKKIL